MRSFTKRIYSITKTFQTNCYVEADSAEEALAKANAIDVQFTPAAAALYMNEADGMANSHQINPQDLKIAIDNADYNINIVAPTEHQLWWNDWLALNLTIAPKLSIHDAMTWHLDKQTPLVEAPDDAIARKLCGIQPIDTNDRFYLFKTVSYKSYEEACAAQKANK